MKKRPAHAPLCPSGSRSCTPQLPARTMSSSSPTSKTVRWIKPQRRHRGKIERTACSARQPLNPQSALASCALKRWNANLGSHRIRAQSEIPLRPRYILEDLRLQRFGRWPLDLAAANATGTPIRAASPRPTHWLEVQDVRFHAESRAFKRGPVANIGHRLKTAPAHRKPSHIDAETPAAVRRRPPGSPWAPAAACRRRVPAPGVERTAKGLPSIQRARFMSPAATSSAYRRT